MLRNELDATPRKWGVGFWGRSSITTFRQDRIRTIKGWAPGEFRLKVDLQNGALRFRGDDDHALPGGNYFLRLQINDLNIRGGRLPVNIDDDSTADITVDVDEDPRQVALTTDFADFDQQIRRTLESASSTIDGVGVSDWLDSADPRPSRKACLLNLMAKLRTAPDAKPLIDHVDFVFFGDVDRIYAGVQKQFYDRLVALARDPKKPFYAEGPPHADIHRLLLTRMQEKGLEGDIADYTLESFRQEGKTCLQAVVAIPRNGDGRYYADLDIDLGNPLQDVEGFFIHIGELLGDSATDHFALRNKLLKGTTKDFVYYKVDRGV